MKNFSFHQLSLNNNYVKSISILFTTFEQIKLNVATWVQLNSSSGYLMKL